MSNIGDVPADNTNTSSQSEAGVRYWCFMCERDFTHVKTDSAEVFCPQCNCISELLETEDDPRSFRPYDAVRETNQPTQPTQQANNVPGSGQGNPNLNQMPQANAPMMGINVVYQTNLGPMRTVNVQNFFPQMFPPQMNQNGATNQPQPNMNQNQPGAPQIGASLFNPMINNMFGMFSSMLQGTMQGGQGGGLFGDIEGRIIEEFLRNDPNRHGPPPAEEESIKRLKKSKYSETCNVKDCSVCQEDYKKEDNLLTLPCDHIFHKDCVETWLKMHNSCPSCRKPLTAPRDSYSENMFA